MTGSMLGGIFSGIGGLIGSGMSLMGQREQNIQNAMLTREQWARDDNAVQRRTADLKAAGINPILAAGQAAQSSPAIPVNNQGYGQAGHAMLGALSTIGEMINSSSISTAQAELLREQANATRVSAIGQGIQNSFMVGDNKRAKEMHNMQLKFIGADTKNREMQTTALEANSADNIELKKAVDSIVSGNPNYHAIKNLGIRGTIGLGKSIVGAGIGKILGR